MPLLLSTPAARLLNAPPKLCPTATTLKLGCCCLAVSTAARTPFSASSHDFQNPVAALQFEQIVVSVVGKLRFVIQLRRERDPRKEIIMSELVESVATNPVASVFRVLSK